MLLHIVLANQRPALLEHSGIPSQTSIRLRLCIQRRCRNKRLCRLLAGMVLDASVIMVADAKHEVPVPWMKNAQAARVGSMPSGRHIKRHAMKC